MGSLDWFLSGWYWQIRHRCRIISVVWAKDCLYLTILIWWEILILYVLVLLSSVCMSRNERLCPLFCTSKINYVTKLTGISPKLVSRWCCKHFEKSEQGYIVLDKVFEIATRAVSIFFFIMFLSSASDPDPHGYGSSCWWHFLQKPEIFLSLTVIQLYWRKQIFLLNFWEFKYKKNFTSTYKYLYKYLLYFSRHGSGSGIQIRI
jgi:hypothetical protein